MVLCAICMAHGGTPPQNVAGIAIRGVRIDAHPLVCIDATGDLIYCAGTFSDSVVVARSRPTTIDRAVSAGKRDVFLAAFTSDLDLLWIQRIGGEADDSVTCLIAAPQGGVIVGTMCGGASVDVPTYSVGGVTYTGRGGYDAVIASFGRFGALRFVRVDGAEFNEFPTALAASGASVYVCGTFVGRSRFGTTVVTDSGRTSAYLQRIDTSGTSQWVVWSRGIVKNDLGRGRAEGGMACTVTDTLISASIGASGGVQWGTSTIVAEATNYELRAAEISVTPDGKQLNARVTLPCRGDSCPTAITASVSASLLAEPQACIPANEIGLDLHTTTDLGAVYEHRFPVGGPQSVVSDLHITPTSLLACGRFQRTFAFDASQLRPDLVADNVALQDGFIIAADLRGNGDWALKLGATTIATVTSVNVHGDMMVAVAPMVGQLVTDAFTLGTSATDTLCAVLVYSRTSTSVFDRENVPVVDIADDQPVAVFDVMGRLVTSLPNASAARTSVPRGIYILVTQHGLAQRFLVD